MFDTAALLAVLRRAPVVPVLIIDRLEDALPLGTALVATLAAGIALAFISPALGFAVFAVLMLTGTFVAGITAHGTWQQRLRGKISVASLRARALQRRAERREREALVRAELLRQGGTVVQPRRSRRAERRARRARAGD